MRNSDLIYKYYAALNFLHVWSSTSFMIKLMFDTICITLCFSLYFSAFHSLPALFWVESTLENLHGTIYLDTFYLQTHSFIFARETTTIRPIFFFSTSNIVFLSTRYFILLFPHLPFLSLIFKFLLTI